MWGLGLGSVTFFLIIAIVLQLSFGHNSASVSRNISPVQTNAQPEYPQQQTTGTLPTAPKAASLPEYSQGFRLDAAVVTDTRTGLMWTRDANLAGKVMNISDAEKWMQTLSVGGYSDWRFPTMKEIQTMRNYFDYSPADSLNSLGFINVQSDVYRTSDNDPQIGIVWGATHLEIGNKERGKAVTLYPHVENAYVWPVRNVR
jgi:hypothetical protein